MIFLLKCRIFKKSLVFLLYIFNLSLVFQKNTIFSKFIKFQVTTKKKKLIVNDSKFTFFRFLIWTFFWKIIIMSDGFKFSVFYFRS